MLADQVDFVIGVDTHRDQHALALIAASTGGIVLEDEIAADQPGYARALALADRHAPDGRVWAVEGTGSYGAGLARFLIARNERVVEVGRPKRDRRSSAKSDALDALLAARGVLAGERLACPRAGGAREALRALQTTREGALRTGSGLPCSTRRGLVPVLEPPRSQQGAFPLS